MLHAVDVAAAWVQQIVQPYRELKPCVKVYFSGRELIHGGLNPVFGSPGKGQTSDNGAAI
jgi:hypothetical protein